MPSSPAPLKDPFKDPLSLFSHELKTPLNTLSIGLSLLSKRLSSKESLEIAQLMEEELASLIHFVEECLDWRSLSGKSLLKPQWSLMGDMLQKALKPFILEARSLDVSFKIQAEDPAKEAYVFMDLEWMSHAAQNIISNSLRHSPAGGSVAIQWELVKTGGMRCSIKDEGPGFPKSAKPFAPFYKARAAHKSPGGAPSAPRQAASASRAKNSGLGLSIAQAIVERHGGWIKAENFGKKGEAAAGAVVSFFLPQARRSHPKTHSQAT